ncbi:glycosyltransferase 87 family protein [Saccharothrix coeruleofusca]|uniref:glycosyltransferase 87 family protein n=1 Tax=Saccharothrix coeruleofusca TaxID=33919 RepID=UPI00166FCE95|nr:glycosyltransferase 87 family protein [Saccharothrix coeruleofusca]
MSSSVWTGRFPCAAEVFACVVAVAAVVCWVAGRPLGVDSAVYRSGALAVLRGESLYGHLAATPDWSPDLPFAYPPFAALLFWPLAALPTQLVWGVFGVLTAVALGVVARLTGPRSGMWWLVPLLVALEPVWRTVGLGQVNALLMALVVVDVLALRGSRWSGLLIGVAAAVKLTPLVFVPHLLVTGRRSDALRAVGAFAAACLAGFVLLPDDSRRYWGSALLGANEALSNAWWGNQSLHGLVHRLAGGRVVLVLAVAVCVVAAGFLVRALHERADHAAALLVTAFCGLLVSPISWTHHWVWVVPVCCLAARRGAWRVLFATAALFSVCALVPVPRGDNRELDWTPLEALVGNAYVLGALTTGLVLVTAVLGGAVRRTPTSRNHETRSRVQAACEPRQQGDRVRPPV